MGHYVYVTRRNDPLSSGEPVILETEWRKIVDANDELSFVQPQEDGEYGAYRIASYSHIIDIL